jgi:hypothetical protein
MKLLNYKEINLRHRSTRNKNKLQKLSKIFVKLRTKKLRKKGKELRKLLINLLNRKLMYFKKWRIPKTRSLKNWNKKKKIYLKVHCKPQNRQDDLKRNFKHN